MNQHLGRGGKLVEPMRPFFRGNGSRQRELQRHHYENACDAEFEITRPHSCGRLYEFLIRHKFRTGLGTLGVNIADKSVLEICCGSGMMAEELARLGARVTGVDLSLAAVTRARERARRYGFQSAFLAGDAETLPFGDGAFDIVAVHDGLHHLDNPIHAIREMARVARSAVLILEPAAAALTRLAVWVGLAADIEDAGNYVRRLSPRRVAEELRAAGFASVNWRRTLMYYPHEPFAWFRWFDWKPAFVAFRALFSLTNVLAGRWGNKLALGATRLAGKA